MLPYFVYLPLARYPNPLFSKMATQSQQDLARSLTEAVRWGINEALIPAGDAKVQVG